MPFTGLAEAFVLASLRRAGVPMQRIRAGVARLRAELGVRPVLASDRLRAAGGELLWLDADGGLAEARSGQLVLREAIEDGLGRVSYDAGGWARAITIRRGDSELVVDPLVNSSRPAPAPAAGQAGRLAGGPGNGGAVTGRRGRRCARAGSRRGRCAGRIPRSCGQ